LLKEKIVFAMLLFQMKILQRLLSKRLIIF
jgi:hypothetical protein